jgi:hypothetical protein
LLEQTVGLEIEETYPKVKAVLTTNGSKILSETAPNQILLKQGSLWGVSPKTAKKIITVNLEKVNEGTYIKVSSKLASDWKNITLIGCAFAVVLVGLCVWMATDLAGFVVTRQTSFWSWLIEAGGNVDLAAAHAFINLTWGLAGFLSVIILLEGAIVVYAHSKIDTFAADALKQLSYYSIFLPHASQYAA